MSARARVLAIVGGAAALAVAAVVGVTLLQTHGERTTVPGAVTKPRAGYPQLELSFGVRGDAEARALARAQRLYTQGKVAQAAAIFGRYHSLEARIGSAFAGWRKGGGVEALQRIVAAHPRSSLAELHLGWAYYQAGRNADAVAAWERTARLQPDTPYAVEAEDILHPSTPPGLPPIVTGFEPPKSLAKLPAEAQLDALRRAASRPDAKAKLLYGVALWNLERPVSAERQFRSAARLEPDDPLARTVAAVGAYTKANPTAAFAKLGPLTGVFPRAPVVRFHLGLLLLFNRERAKAVAQLRLAVSDGAHTIYGTEARALLDKLGA